MLLLLGLASFIAYKLVANVWRSPLRNIPGPWLAVISDLWVTVHVIRLQKYKYIHSLFNKYGPIVRIGPNKIAFNDATVAKDVYAVKKFEKGPMYLSFKVIDEGVHAMTILDNSLHALRKRAFSSQYTPGNLEKFQFDFRETLQSLIRVMYTADATVVDSIPLFRSTMADILLAFTFNVKRGAVEQWTPQSEDILSKAINDFQKKHLLLLYFPKFITRSLYYIPSRRWKAFYNCDHLIGAFVREQLRNAKTLGALERAEGEDDNEKIPLLRRLLTYKYGKDEPMPDEHVIAESVAHIVAGSDTSSNTLSFWCWELSRRPDVAEKLRKELDDAIPDPSLVPEFVTLSKLPYLDAFVKEGKTLCLRVYAAAPEILERVVPTSPDHVPYNMLGHSLPGGTIVGTQIWSIHRDPSVFTSPDNFIPERWLEASAEQYNEMSQHLVPFGIGPRMCGGKNLAQMMLPWILATVIRNFDIESPPQTNERSMAVRARFASFPAGMKCELRFRPRRS